MDTLEMLYEGKAKQIFKTGDPSLVLVRYKDAATAFNGEKRAELSGKGELNNRISSFFFQLLTKEGIPHHFVREVSACEQLVKKGEHHPAGSGGEKPGGRFHGQKAGAGRRKNPAATGGGVLLQKR